MLAFGIALMTPAFALAALPFAGAATAAIVSARRAGAARDALGLGRAPRRWLAVDLGLFAGAAAVLALACAQPAVSRTHTRYANVDVQVAFVFDVSRSMLASPRPGAPNRLDRSRAAALRIRERVPEIPVGLLSLTDRAFPLAFPDTDIALFRDAVAQTVGIQEPPPRLLGNRSATDFRSLRQLAIAPYFRRSAPRRAVVVFSDAEAGLMPRSLADSFVRHQVRVYVVRVWRPSERVWRANRRPERYRPDDSALPAVKRFVAATHGKVFAERDEAAVVSELQRLGRGGKRVEIGSSRDRKTLAPYLLGLAALPLAGWARRRSH